MPKDYPWGKGTPTWVRDATANDSDKSFTVPTGKVWDLLYIVAQLSTTATVGNRALIVKISNGADSVFIPLQTAVIAASQVGINRVYFNAPQATSTIAMVLLDASAVSNVGLTNGVGRVILPAGYVINVKDNAAIDAAADDLTVVLHYVEYDA